MLRETVAHLQAHGECQGHSLATGPLGPAPSPSALTPDPSSAWPPSPLGKLQVHRRLHRPCLEL